MDRYSKGILYVLTVPENQGDLYNYPQAVVTSIKRQLLGDFPVWVDAPAKVSFVCRYDNHTFIVQSFLAGQKTTVTRFVVIRFVEAFAGCGFWKMSFLPRRGRRRLLHLPGGVSRLLRGRRLR